MPRNAGPDDADIYVVSPSLDAVPLTQLHSQFRNLELRRSSLLGTASAPGNALPISPDGMLVAGQLYESSADPSVRYYLPQYTVHELRGLYQVSLKWIDGLTLLAPIARLTVDLFAPMPAARGVTLQEIPHQAVVRLGYRLVVEDPLDPGHGASLGARAADGRSAFWYEIGALQPAGERVRRCQKDIYSKQEFDRLYQIMTDSAFLGMLDVHCFATIGRRTYRQIAVTAGSVGRSSAGAAHRNARARRGILGADEQVAAFAPLFQLTTPTDLIRATTPLPPPIPVTPNVAFGNIGLFVNSASQPDLKPQPTPMADLFRRSDLTVAAGGRQIAAVPIGAMVEASGEPALLRVAIEARQGVRPFCFPLETNGYIFDIPGQLRPGKSHTLQQYTVTTNDNRTGVFFYDPGLDLFYYQPTEFRLSRLAHPLDQSTYQPYLIITMMNVATDDGSDASTNAAPPSCRVNITYQALPYMERDLLDAATNYFKAQGIHQMPRFAALTPVKTRLTLMLPKDEVQTMFEPVERPSITISFEEGIADNINISEAQFRPIAAAFLAGLGIEGTVEAFLLDEESTPVKVKLRLTLNDTAGPLFDSSLLGPVDGAQDRYSVLLRNRVESPVRITRLDPVAVDGNVIAYPPAQQNLIVQPGMTVPIEYKITPPQAQLRSLDPIVFANVVLDDIAQRKRLWRQLIVEEGYFGDPDHTFPVNVSIDPIYFSNTPPGTQPLTGVRVDFRGGGNVALTAAAPARAVTLQQGYLAALLLDPLSYKYVVTNLHADPDHPDQQVDGAQSDLLNDEVIDLQVEPVQLSGTQ